MKFHSLYPSPNIFTAIKYTRLRWAGHPARLEERKPTIKRPLEKPRHRWENNIRMDIKEIVISAGIWVESRIAMIRESL